MLIFKEKSVSACREMLPTNHLPGTTVIRSVIEAHRAVPLSYGKHIRGYHPVKEGHGAIAFESLIERDTVTALAKFPELVRIESQPLTIFFEVDGVRHKYTPDLRVTLSEVPFQLERLGFKRVTYIECKPARKVVQQQYEIDRNSRAVHMAVDLPLVLIMDEDLKAGRLEVSYGR